MNKDIKETGMEKNIKTVERLEEDRGMFIPGIEVHGCQVFMGRAFLEKIYVGEPVAWEPDPDNKNLINIFIKNHRVGFISPVVPDHISYFKDYQFRAKVSEIEGLSGPVRLTINFLGTKIDKNRKKVGEEVPKVKAQNLEGLGGKK